MEFILDLLLPAEFGLTVINFEIALGYRDSLSGPWKRLARGNVTRTLQCRVNHWVR